MTAPRPFERQPGSRQEIDTRARSISLSARDGAITEREARWSLAALVYRSDIPEVVVRRATTGRHVPLQVVSDSVDYVREQLIKMIAGATPKLDLSYVAGGSSLCGWASRIITGPYVFPKTNFDTRTRRTREVTVSEDTISGLVALRSMGDYGVSPAFSEEVEQRHDLVDEYLTLAKGLREWELVHLNAEHLCVVSLVAPPRRAVHLPNRRSLSRKLELVETACRDDLRRALDGEEVTTASLATLFSKLSLDEIESVERLEPFASQLLARSALTPVPPPRANVVKTLRTNIASVVGGSRAAGSLCRAFVDVVSEVDGSEFAPGSTPRRIKKVAERRANFAAWGEAARSLVERDLLGLGETPDQVLTSLSRQVRAISLERAGRTSQRQSA